MLNGLETCGRGMAMANQGKEGSSAESRFYPGKNRDRYRGIDRSCARAPARVFIRKTLWFMNGFLPAPRVSIAGIEKFWCLVDRMDEDSNDILNFFLVFYIILRPRFGMPPHPYPHDKPFGKFEDTLVRFVIADEKQTSLPEMAHQGQGSRPFPVFPRRQDIH